MNRIAYFSGTYPSLSETFVQREIDYLSAQGLEVFVFATRRFYDLSADGERRDGFILGIGGLFFAPILRMSFITSN